MDVFTERCTVGVSRCTDDCDAGLSVVDNAGDCARAIAGGGMFARTRDAGENPGAWQKRDG